MTRFLSDPNVCAGALCIEGTRIPVRAVMSFHDIGSTWGEIAAQYPTLTKQQIEDAIALGERLRLELEPN